MGIRLILITLITISIIGLLFFLWFRKRRIQKKKEKIKELKEDFQEEIDPDPIDEKDKQILDKIVDKIKDSIEKDENITKIDIEENCDIKIVTPDVISIKTPTTRLHKSFNQIKFEKIEDYDQGKKIHLKS